MLLNNLKSAFDIFFSSSFLIIYTILLLASFISTLIYASKNPDIDNKRIMINLVMAYVYMYLIIISLAVLLGVCLAFIDLLPKLLPTK